MPKEGYLNVKMDEELRDAVKKAAEEDDRTYLGETRYLIRLGLDARLMQQQIQKDAGLLVAAEKVRDEYKLEIESSGKPSDAAGGE